MSELPRGWVKASLDELCEFNPRHNADADRSMNVSFIPMPAVSDQEGAILPHETRPLEEIWKGYTHFRDGDVIFAKITPCMENGKIAVARDLHNGIACGSTEFHVLRTRGAILPDYLWRFLRQKSFREEAERHMTGAVGQRRVPANYLKNTAIPLAPLNEQKRIVAKLDSLFARTRKAREELARIPILIEHYKQVVLAAAYETLLSERAELIPLGDLSEEVRNGLSRKPHDAPPGAKILRISSVRPGYVNVEDVRFYLPEGTEDITRYYLKKGDLLFTRYNGNPNYVAVCGMFPECEETFVYPDKLIRVRLDTERVLSEFIELIMQAPQVREILRPYIKTAAGQHRISGKDLKQTPVPVVPLHRQRQFVKAVRKQFNSMQYVKEEQKRTSELLDHLEEATLLKAFRGELMSHDPNDEPADVLLERIRTESHLRSNHRGRLQKSLMEA